MQKPDAAIRIASAPLPAFDDPDNAYHDGQSLKMLETLYPV
jgi:hypothetical protein